MHIYHIDSIKWFIVICLNFFNFQVFTSIAGLFKNKRQKCKSLSGIDLSITLFAGKINKIYDLTGIEYIF